MEGARKVTYVSIALIPLGALLGFLHGGLGLTLMMLGWLGVLFFDGPAQGQVRFGPTLTPPASDQPQTPAA